MRVYVIEVQQDYAAQMIDHVFGARGGYSSLLSLPTRVPRAKIRKPSYPIFRYVPRVGFSKHVHAIETERLERGEASLPEPAISGSDNRPVRSCDAHASARATAADAEAEALQRRGRPHANARTRTCW